ncbi:hypothetical protein BWQ96_07586 [Gracilariopsis chorda]|uniref:Transmembrane protein n=1 Tax=Gracilariopsis chorda TaxID=448386 RepID=A0A2V3INJ9_9FLOR|nr:hypothetical protein BWQ96_07586 [Gracilariopsis chorda]|eukprot:PXF42700.1 hypothetical protein BWQ96_07586 [Gracilariopsis chorda]
MLTIALKATYITLIISVKRSKRRRRFLQAAALVFFVILEILLVFSVHPYSAFRSVPCVSVDTSLRFSVGNHSPQAESAATGCRTLNRGRFTEHNATFSMSTGRTACGKKPLFRFYLNSTTLFTNLIDLQRSAIDTENHTVACASRPVSTRDNKCLLVLRAENDLFISDLLYTFPPAAQVFDIEQLPFSATRLPYKPSQEQAEFLGARAANVLLEGVRKPVLFRHRVFSGFSNETCRERDVDPLHTQIHPAMFTALVLIWCACFLTYTVLRCVKPLGTPFFDMRDPMHWAERTYRPSRVILERDAVIQAVVFENGKRRVLVCPPGGNHQPGVV